MVDCLEIKKKCKKGKKGKRGKRGKVGKSCNIDTTGAPSNAILYYDKQSDSIKGCPIMNYNQKHNIMSISGDLNVSGNLDPQTVVLVQSEIIPDQPVTEPTEADPVGVPYACCMLWADKYSNFNTTGYIESDTESGNEFKNTTISSIPAYGYLDISGTAMAGTYYNVPFFITNGNYYIDTSITNEPYNKTVAITGSAPDNPFILIPNLYYTFKMNLSFDDDLLGEGFLLYITKIAPLYKNTYPPTPSLMPEYINYYSSGRFNGSDSYYNSDEYNNNYLYLKISNYLNKYSITWTVKNTEAESKAIYIVAGPGQIETTLTVSSSLTISVSPYL